MILAISETYYPIILSNNLIDIDLLVDRILNGNLSIDDGVSNFRALLYNTIRHTRYLVIRR